MLTEKITIKYTSSTNAIRLTVVISFSAESQDSLNTIEWYENVVDNINCKVMQILRLLWTVVWKRRWHFLNISNSG